MDHSENLLAEIQCFVTEFLDVSIDRVLPSTRLSDDLGIDGDDAYELMEAFAERFDVDLSDFRWKEHFGNEGLPFWFVLLLLPSMWVFILLWDWNRWAGGLLAGLFLIGLILRGLRGYPHSITIQDLANAAMAKQWDYIYRDSD